MVNNAIFHTSKISSIEKLKKLTIQGCNKLEYLFLSSVAWDSEGVIQLILPELKSLTLENLPALKSICNRRAVMLCDSLKYVVTLNCKGLRRFPLYLPLHGDGQPSPPPSLKQIVVWPKEWWESLEWDHPNANNALLPFRTFYGSKRMEFIDIDIDGENFLLPASVQELVTERCNNLKCLNDISAIKHAKELKCCRIWDCKGVECVLSSSINPLVQKLENLDLSHLENLDALIEAEAITKSPLPPNTFSSLKIISVWWCHKIKKLFPFWMNLQSLEEIEIRECRQMEEIIAWDLEEVGGEKEGVIQLNLPKLKSLTLENLPTLKSICNWRAVMVCDSLKYITVLDCKSLRRFPLYLPLLGNGQPSPPPSLKQIIVWPKEWWKSLEWDHPDANNALLPFRTFYGRKRMEFTDIFIDGENILLPASVKEFVIERWNNLRSLNDISAIKDAKELKCCKMWNCKGMECVLSSSINPLVQKLEVLDLYNLESLDALFEAKAITKSPLPPADTFSSLKRIGVSKCNKIKKLFPFWMYLQSLEEIEIRRCEQIEEIIVWDPEEAGGQEGANQLILPKLKRLTLIYLPALRSICSSRAVMVCDSLEEIWIWYCKGLRRIPLYLPLLNGQPSPPPSLRKINVWPQLWWESLEWDHPIHPNAKDVLLPFRVFFPWWF